VDAWLLTKGILSTCFEPDGRQGIILRASGAATIAGEDLTHEGLTASVETALRLGADVLATTAFIGSTYEQGKTLEDKKFDSQYLALGARVAVEHGADMVKTYYIPQSFDKVIAGCPVPLMIAGGPKCETDLDTIKMIGGALASGARGIVMGRNIWQNPRPAQLLEVIWRMIHQGLSIEDTSQMLGA